MFRKSLMALAIASLCRGTRAGGGVGRRGQAAGHDADRGRRRKGRQQGRHDSRSTPAASQPPASFQPGSTDAPRPVREREAAPGDHRQGHGRAGRQAHRRHQGAAEALPDDARRRLSDAPHGRRCRSAFSTTPRRTPPARRPPTAASRSRTSLAGYPFPIPKTGSEAIWNHLLRYNGLGYDTPSYDNWNVDSAGVPTLAVERPTPTGRGRSTIRRRPASSTPTDPYWLHQAALRRAGAPQRRGAADVDARQPAEAAAPRLAVPAGPAPRQARAGPRLRHAEPRRRGRRRPTTTSRCSTARWTASTASSSARRRCTFPYSNYRLTYHQDGGGHHQAQPPQSGSRALGAAPRLGGRGDAQAGQAPHLQQARRSTSTRTAGRRWPPTSTTRAASSIASSFAYPVVQLRRAGAVRRHVRDLRLQLGRLQHHRPVRSVQRPQVHDRAATRHLLVAGSAGRSGRALRPAADIAREHCRCGAKRGAASDVPNRDIRIMTRPPCLRGVARRGARRSRRRACGCCRLRRRARHAGAGIAAREPAACCRRWHAPADRLVAVGQRGHVVLSTDGGTTWKQATVPVSSDLAAVYFVDGREGLGGRPRRRRPAHGGRRRIVAAAARRTQGQRSAGRRDGAQGRGGPDVRRREGPARRSEALPGAGRRQAVPRRLVFRCAQRLRRRRVQPRLPHRRRRRDVGAVVRSDRQSQILQPVFDPSGRLAISTSPARAASCSSSTPPRSASRRSRFPTRAASSASRPPATPCSPSGCAATSWRSDDGGIEMDEGRRRARLRRSSARRLRPEGASCWPTRAGASRRATTADARSVPSR